MSNVNKYINDTGGAKKLNFLFTGCRAEYIHDNINYVSHPLPINTKVVSLSNYSSYTKEADFRSIKMDRLLNLSEGENLKFEDLIKLYCLGKFHSENTPVIGVQGPSNI